MCTLHPTFYVCPAQHYPNHNPNPSRNWNFLCLWHTYEKLIQETCMSVIATCSKIFLVQISCTVVQIEHVLLMQVFCRRTPNRTRSIWCSSTKNLHQKFPVQVSCTTTAGIMHARHCHFRAYAFYPQLTCSCSQQSLKIIVKVKLLTLRIK